MTSSAAKNSNPSVLQIASALNSEYAFFINKDGVNKGIYKNGELRIVKKGKTHDDPNPQAELVKIEDYKPSCALYQRYNDAYNTPYMIEHNIGFLTIDKKKVENAFLTKKGKTSTRSWDFANDIYWEGK